MSAATKAGTAGGRDRALWIAGGVWGLWAVLPSLVLHASVAKPGAARAFITAQVGPGAVPYLGAAPPSVLTFLLVSYLLALPVLILLAQRVRREAASPESARSGVNLVIRRCGAFSALYLAGSAIVACVMRARGLSSELVWGWAPRLALFGLFTTLPQVGWVFAVALLVRRFWPSLVLTLLGVLVCGSAGHVLAVKQVAFPTPMFLRVELLSGRAEAVTPALLGMLIWGLGLLLVGVGIRELRAYRLMRAAAISA